MKQLAEGVLERAFGHLRRCGAGRRECVVYLTSPANEPTLVDGVLHPRHMAGPGGYDLGSAAVAELWRDLLASNRSIRIQVHTHPGAAYHSARDDELAIVHTPGFLSLVIPDFGLGAVGLDRAFLAERTVRGAWVRVRIEDRLTVTP